MDFWTLAGLAIGAGLVGAMGGVVAGYGWGWSACVRTYGWKPVAGDAGGAIKWDRRSRMSAPTDKGKST